MEMETDISHSGDATLAVGGSSLDMSDELLDGELTLLQAGIASGEGDGESETATSEKSTSSYGEGLADTASSAPSSPVSSLESSAVECKQAAEHGQQDGTEGKREGTDVQEDECDGGDGVEMPFHAALLPTNTPTTDRPAAGKEQRGQREEQLQAVNSEKSIHTSTRTVICAVHDHVSPQNQPSSSSSHQQPPHLEQHDSLTTTARLRQERDEAVSRLAFVTAEHAAAESHRAEELDALRHGRDSLKRDLEQMVGRLIQGEDAQARFVEATDALCLSEARERQAKSRLESALAELDELRARADFLPDEASTKTSIAPCDCKTALRELRQQFVDLESALEDSHAQYKGASNLALSLQTQLRDTLTEKDILEDALASEQAKNIALEQQIEDLAEAHAEQTSQLVSERTTATETLDWTTSQLEGSSNLAVELQRQLETHSLENVDLRQELVTAQIGIRQREVQIKSIQTRAENLQDQNDSLQGDVADGRSDLHNMTIAVLQLRAHAKAQADESLNKAKIEDWPAHDNTSLIVTLVQSSRMLSALRQDKLRSCMRSQCDEARVSAIEQEKMQLQTSLQRTTIEVQQHADTIQMLTESSQDIERKIRKLKLEIQTHQANLEASTALNTQLALDRDRQQAEVACAATAIKTLQEQQGSLQRELKEAREHLRAAEEEGRILVADFNILSEELDRRQQDDEAKIHPDTELEDRLHKLVEAHGGLERLSKDQEKELKELRQGIRDMDEQMAELQTAVEETDDKYLGSLKTIKKQALALDKLKVRNEALARANAQLSQPIIRPAAPLSAKKRALPQDFVMPDPGPAIVVVRPDSKGEAGPAGSAMPPPSSTPATVFPLKAKADGRSIELSYTTAGRRQPASAELKIAAPLAAGIASEKQAIAVSAKSAKPPSGVARAPLAALPSQTVAQSQVNPAASLQQEKVSAGAPKAPTLGSRAPFKPATSLANRTMNTATAAGTQDTRSLLAALHALKRPTNGL